MGTLKYSLYLHCEGRAAVNFVKNAFPYLVDTVLINNAYKDVHCHL